MSNLISRKLLYINNIYDNYKGTFNVENDCFVDICMGMEKFLSNTRAQSRSTWLRFE